MKIENILIEHFPRLKCANFSIIFNKSFEDVSSVRIHLRPTEIFVSFENEHCTTIELSSLSVQIQIDSLSLLIVKNNLISFRINIASNFHEEILQPLNTKDQLTKLPKHNTLAIQSNDEFYVICDNCAGPLSNQLKYRRLLELPSEQMDSNDWFCHKTDQIHCHTTNDHGICNDQFNINKLSTNTNDLLFGNYFVLFNRNNFINIQLNSIKKMVHCRRCLNHIGECLPNDSFKLWNGNIKIRKINESVQQRIFNDSESLFKCFLNIIDSISYEYEMLGYQTLKLLFEAYNLNGTETFLFIQTMSRNLELYQMRSNDQDECHVNGNGLDTIQLQNTVSLIRVNGIKCLFLCEEDTDPTLVQFWQKDVNVVSARISIEMLNCAVEHLQHLAKYVPESFRMNNGFCLSYLSSNIK